VDEAWNGPAALDGKRIATSYPHLLKRYLDQKVSPLNPVC
jgi:ATP phosphoribosyltransferase